MADKFGRLLSVGGKLRPKMDINGHFEIESRILLRQQNSGLYYQAVVAEWLRRWT